mmetsp:Transcript_125790/g.355689  ORF Transcript_125790/g.355689 Transcript_125790/m.355689 type:complete len:210 (-) Transcript_125790:122-751(-)
MTPRSSPSGGRGTWRVGCSRWCRCATRSSLPASAWARLAWWRTYARGGGGHATQRGSGCSAPWRRPAAAAAAVGFLASKASPCCPARRVAVTSSGFAALTSCLGRRSACASTSRCCVSAAWPASGSGSRARLRSATAPQRSACGTPPRPPDRRSPRRCCGAAGAGPPVACTSRGTQSARRSSPAPSWAWATKPSAAATRWPPPRRRTAC